MTLKTLAKALAFTVTLSAGTAAMAAGAYCPGDSNAFTPAGAGYTGATTGTAPAGGNDAPAGWNSYVWVEGGLAGSTCYYRAGNLDTPQPPGPGGASGWVDFGLAGYLVKWEDDQAPGGGLLTFSAADFTIGAGLDWSAPVYIGFHFGGGTQDPDSFIVQLDSTFFAGGVGTSDFAFTSTQGQGLSNIYLFGTRCAGGDCQITVPEPGSLALLGAGLAGLALIRRRRRI